MHRLGRIALASHALPAVALALPGARWPALLAWGAVEAVVASELLRPASRSLAPNIRRGDGHGDRVAITFDDGPSEGETEVLLDRLAAHGVAAAFFLVGRRARALPRLVRSLAAAGHTIGNHTHSHPALWSLLGRRAVASEVGDAQAAISDLTGEAPRWFRPPMGHKNFHLAEVLDAHHLRQVTWSVRSLDTVLRGRDRVLRRVLPQAQRGDIMLFHEGLGDARRGSFFSLQIIDPLLDGLRLKGLQAVSLQALLSPPPEAPPTRPPAAPRDRGSSPPSRSR